jgi:hypothetical protein
LHFFWLAEELEKKRERREHLDVITKEEFNHKKKTTDWLLWNSFYLRRALLK